MPTAFAADFLGGHAPARRWLGFSRFRWPARMRRRVSNPCG